MKPFYQWTGEDLVFFLKSVDKKTWIKVGIGAAIFTVIFVVFIWPAWFSRVEVKNKIKGIETQIIRLQTLRRKEKGWMQDKEDYQNFIQEVKERLHAATETSLLLGLISKLASQSDVSIIASRPHNTSPEFPKPFDAVYEAHLYDFTVEGGYHEMGEFISRIESNPKILQIQLFHMNPREKNPGVHIANLTISAASGKKSATV